VYDGFAPKIAILDNVIEDAFLQDELPERPENFTVGWTPSQSHNEDAEEFAPYLHEFLKRNPSARLRLYGPSEVSHPTPQIECIPWNKDMGGYVQSLNFHVGIAPLARNVFNKGKSGIKAIEYGARGIATVASDWPQYRRTVVERKTGYLVGSPEMMVSKLDYLLRHPGTVARMGRDARAYIGEHHTVRTRVLDWEKAFEGIVK
jgi:glycosyltransferase involved in cell wall biosynthesis